MKPIDDLKDDEEDDDEANGLAEEKLPRKIGIFIKHEDFENPDPLLAGEQVEDPYKDLNDIERVFVQDHDFVCIQRQRNEEFEQTFDRGL